MTSKSDPRDQMGLKVLVYVFVIVLCMCANFHPNQIWKTLFYVRFHLQ